jgi:hypothetical protein
MDIRTDEEILSAEQKIQQTADRSIGILDRMDSYCNSVKEMIPDSANRDILKPIYEQNCEQLVVLKKIHEENPDSFADLMVIALNSLQSRILNKYPTWYRRPP